MKDYNNFIQKYLSKSDRRKKFTAAFVSLAMLITFTVPMVLTEPAVSQTRNSFAPVGDILPVQMFNANGNPITNLAGGELSDVALIIGEPDGGEETRAWVKNCSSASEVINAIRNEYFLGIASDFCIFLEENFRPTSSDAEGRVAVGGNVVFGENDNYQIGAGDFEDSTELKNTTNYQGLKNFAHLIIGEGLYEDDNEDGMTKRIVNIAPYSTINKGANAAIADPYKRIVIPANMDMNDSVNHHTDDNKSNVLYGSEHKHYTGAINEKEVFYQTKLIDFKSEFEWLRSQGEQLANVKAIEGVPSTGSVPNRNGNKEGNIYTFTGPGTESKENIIYFYIDSWEKPVKIDFVGIPDDANIVVTCPASSFNIGEVQTFINNKDISNGRTSNGDDYTKNNNHPDSERILYNFYNATTGNIEGNSNGTVFAPNADINGGGGHLSGSLIAKSFAGSTEFGYRPYRGPASIIPSSSGYGVPIKKIIKGTTEGLAGATFTIFGYDENAADKCGDPITTFTSDESGNGYVDLQSKVDFTKYDASDYTDNKVNSHYIIKETESPLGFILDDSKYYDVKLEEKIKNTGSLNGTEIPTEVITKMTTQVFKKNGTSYVGVGNPEEFVIELNDIYGYGEESNKYCRLRRELKINKGEGTCEDIIYIDLDEDGNIIQISEKGTGEPTETRPIAVSTTDVNVTDEHGAPVTTKNYKYDNYGNVFSFKQIGWSDKKSDDSPIKIHSMIFYYIDDENADVAETDDTNCTKTSEIVREVFDIVQNGSTKDWWQGITIEDFDEYEGIDNILGIKVVLGRDNPGDTSQEVNCKLQMKDKNGNYLFVDTDNDDDKKYGKHKVKIEANQATNTIYLGFDESACSNYDTQIQNHEIDENNPAVTTQVNGTFTVENVTAISRVVTNYPVGSVIAKDNLTTYTTASNYTCKYDEGNVMFMPQPANAPEFANEYGLVFVKTSKSGDETGTLKGAKIDLENSSGDKIIEDILGGDFCKTIKTSMLTTGEIYSLVETEAPTGGYEIAAPIYIRVNAANTKVEYSYDQSKWTEIDLTKNNTEQIEMLTMVDVKVSGLKLNLSKVDFDDNTISLDGARFQLYSGKSITEEGAELVMPYGFAADASENDKSFPVPKTGLDLFKYIREQGNTNYNTNYIKDGYLVPGDYFLYEAVAPGGYDGTGNEFRFRVNYDKSTDTYSLEALSASAASSTACIKDVNVSGNKNVFIKPNDGVLHDVIKIEIDFTDNAPTDRISVWDLFDNGSDANKKKENVSKAVINDVVKKNSDDTEWGLQFNIPASKTVAIEFTSGIDFGTMKLNNNSLDVSHIKEVRIYQGDGAGGSGGGNSGGGSSGTGNYPSGVTVSDTPGKETNDTIEVTGDALANAKKNPDAAFITFDLSDFNEYKGGQIHIKTTSEDNFDSNQCGSNALKTNATGNSYTLTEILNLAKGSSKANSLDEITAVRFLVWGPDFKNITFPLSSETPAPQSAPRKLTPLPAPFSINGSSSLMPVKVMKDEEYFNLDFSDFDTNISITDKITELGLENISISKIEIDVSSGVNGRGLVYKNPGNPYNGGKQVSLTNGTNVIELSESGYQGVKIFKDDGSWTVNAIIVYYTEGSGGSGNTGGTTPTEIASDATLSLKQDANQPNTISYPKFTKDGVDDVVLDGTSISLKNVKSFIVQIKDPSTPQVYTTDVGVNGLDGFTNLNNQNVYQYYKEYNPPKDLSKVEIKNYGSNLNVQYLEFKLNDGTTYSYGTKVDSQAPTEPPTDAPTDPPAVTKYKIANIIFNGDASNLEVTRVTFLYEGGTTKSLINVPINKQKDVWSIDVSKLPQENVIGVKVEATGYNGVFYVQGTENSYAPIFDTSYSSTHDFTQGNFMTSGVTADTGKNDSGNDLIDGGGTGKIPSSSGSGDTPGTGGGSTKFETVDLGLNEGKVTLGGNALSDDNKIAKAKKIEIVCDAAPDSFTVKVNGTEVTDGTVSTENGWTWTKEYSADTDITGLELTGISPKSIIVTSDTDKKQYIYDSRLSAWVDEANPTTLVVPNKKAGEKIGVTVIKKWEGDKGIESDVRPSKITVKLTRDKWDVTLNKFVDDTTFDDAAENTIDLNDAGKWQYTWNGLERYVDPTIKLDGSISPHILDTNGNVVKVYRNEIGEIKTTPTDGYVLYQDEEGNDVNYLNLYYYHIAEYSVPGKSNGTTLTDEEQEDVDRFKNYDSTSPVIPISDGSGSAVITNTLKTMDITAEKKWAYKEGGNAENDPAVPSSITVKLLYSKDNGATWQDYKIDKSGKSEVYTKELTKADSWTATFENVFVNYQYKIEEVGSLANWKVKTVTTATEAEKKTIITNELKSGSLTINKTWKNDSSTDRPENLKFNIYRTTKDPNPTFITNVQEENYYENYAKALQLSLYFYDANMCGDDVDENSHVTWRKDCHSGDSYKGITVPGGYHDAGDHTMFGLPQGFTASTLGWSYYDFKAAYDSLGLTEHYQVIMRRFCDFFVDSTKLNAENEVDRFMWQKGNPETDQSVWASPESELSEKFGGEQWTTNSASNIAADYAAALAQYYINFEDNTAYGEHSRDDYLKYAEALYAFSTKNNSPVYYNGNKDDECASEQAWAAAWLYLATDDDTYKTDCEAKMNGATINKLGYYYSDVMPGAMCVYKSHIDKSYDASTLTSFLSSNCTGTGYKVLDDWGSARHNALLQTVALSATKYIDGVDYTDWCEGQMGIILGHNEFPNASGTCFVVGFADNSAKSPHHRAASNYVITNWDTDCNQKGKIEYSSIDGSHTLVGALVGGPTGSGYYSDDMKDSKSNEVALDYQVGLTAAAAGLYELTGKGTPAAEAELSAMELNPYDETPMAAPVNYDTFTVAKKTGAADVTAMNIGEKLQLVLAETEDQESVAWSSASTNISIEGNVVTANEDGIAVLKATIGGTVVAELKVNVSLNAVTVPDVSSMETVAINKLMTPNGDTWSLTINDLPLTDKNGRIYYYYIQEVATGLDGTITGKGSAAYYPISYTGNGSTISENAATSFSVTNKKPDSQGVSMPSTGGTGTHPYTAIGFIMIGGAFAVFALRRRKEQDA